MTTATIKPRRPWLAAILSFFFNGLGYVYAGKLRRFVVWWLFGAWVLLPLALATIVLPLGRFGFVPLLVIGLSYRLLLAIDTFRVARRNHESRLQWYQRWWIYALLLVSLELVNMLAVEMSRTFVAASFEVPARNMSPAILPGERMMVDMFTVTANNLQRGDVVVYYSQGPGSPLFPMRIAALPGDEIEVRAGKAILNGQPVDEPYAFIDPTLPADPQIDDFDPLTVPAGHFFVLGDNRRRAYDSRFTGPFPMSDLVGRVRFIYWSRKRTYPDPLDFTQFNTGEIQWDRIGKRLD